MLLAVVIVSGILFFIFPAKNKFQHMIPFIFIVSLIAYFLYTTTILYQYEEPWKEPLSLLNPLNKTSSDIDALRMRIDLLEK